jgi:NAD-dependent dihydropyrimidine dehydrogenase PreA subunit
MPYIITEACIGTEDKSCVEVCPVDCIHPGENQLFINPDECIECAACEPACPVNAIYLDVDVPEKWKDYIDKNADFFKNGGQPAPTPKP